MQKEGINLSAAPPQILSEAETVYDGYPDVRYCGVSSCSFPAISSCSDVGSVSEDEDENPRSPGIGSRPPSSLLQLIQLIIVGTHPLSASQPQLLCVRPKANFFQTNSLRARTG